MVNKFLIISCFLFHYLYCSSCTSQLAVSNEMSQNIDAMIDGYCNRYCNYPETLEDLIDYVEENRAFWSQTGMAKEMESTISFFQKNKNEILLNFSHPTMTEMKLLIMYQNDTMYYKHGEWNFPYIDDVIRSYSKAYLKWPASLEDLLCFDSIISSPIDEYVPVCWTVTKNYLLKNRSKLNWKCEGDTLLITTLDDTIAYHIESFSQFGCNSYLANETLVFRFFDRNFNLLFSKELDKEFKQQLSFLRQKNLIEATNTAEIHILQFSTSGGLSAFCEDDAISLESNWFKEVANLSQVFAKKHKLSKIIFPVPDY